MANIKSAQKRIRVTAAKTLKNKMYKSAFKTALKKYEGAVASGDKTAAAALYPNLMKKIDQAAAKGIIHKNNAARKKSAFTKKLNVLAASH